MTEFAYTLRRIDLIKKSLEGLILRNEELIQKNKKLNRIIESLEAQAAARERVLIAIENETKKQVRGEDIQTSQEEESKTSV